MFPWEDLSSSVCRAQRERIVSSRLERAFSTLVPTLLVTSPYGRDQQQPPEQQPEPSDSWQQLEPPECWPPPPPQKLELWGLWRWDLRRLWWLRQQPPHPSCSSPRSWGRSRRRLGEDMGSDMGVGTWGDTWQDIWEEET